jgi:hypothetical protein
MGLIQFHWHLVLSSHLVLSWMKFLVHSVMEVRCIEGVSEVKIVILTYSYIPVSVGTEINYRV